MKDLSSYRKDWRERERLETELLRSMSIAEGVAELEAMREAFRERDGQDAAAVAEHRAAPTELQSRLARLKLRQP